jgi:hypothetical protein
MLVSQPKMLTVREPAGVLTVGVDISIGVTSTGVAVEVAVMISAVVVLGTGDRMMAVGVWIDGVRDGNAVGGLYGVRCAGQPPQLQRSMAAHAQQATIFMSGLYTKGAPRGCRLPSPACVRAVRVLQGRPIHLPLTL